MKPKQTCDRCGETFKPLSIRGVSGFMECACSRSLNKEWKQLMDSDPRRPNMISNIRYGELGKILFDFEGKTLSIKEPKDVLLIGWPGADKWIIKNYGFLLNGGA